MYQLRLKTNREKSIQRKHPWIFSGAVQEIDGNPGLGETVKVVSSGGEELGCAAYSPRSSIRARMWSFETQQEINDVFIENKMRVAINLRLKQNIINSTNNSCRLINAESDGLPGLIVDLYADLLVVQLLSTGPERWKDTIVKSLISITGKENIFERSDIEVRKLEGLPLRKGILAGKIPDTPVEIVENGKRFLVDIVNGQKTGFYLDQRENRRTIKQYAENRKALNCFSYSGAFTVYLLEGGADNVTSIDSSQKAIDLAKKNIEINDLPEDKIDWINGDVFKELRYLRDRGLSYDMVILDPPKFAPTVAQVRSASRGYKDINLLAFKLLKPGGILATFSCSGGIDRRLFQKIVADAALDANVNALVLEQLSQGADHPIALNFPEGAYLKGLICYVIEK
ncbi:MAG: class I SAM-dependent rRNA methyltransferase [Anaerolineaceae bacterium]|nr:class I SAM-dependent rRNA methyltransferase [Anaerolineaceae bacterium]